MFAISQLSLQADRYVCRARLSKSPHEPSTVRPLSASIGRGRVGGRQWEERNMEITSLIVFIIIGAIAGWLAGQLVKGYGFGLIGNIVVGIVGAFIAGWLLPRLGIAIGGGIIAAIINATIGAVILLLLLRLVKRA
jgi:uncharacterized membrane protein YeaQ/YmgE (transglycosylase-associated protein family)